MTTVKELINALKKYDPESVVVMQKPIEAYRYCNVSEATHPCHIINQHSENLTCYFNQEKAPNSSVKAVILWPEY